MKHKQVLLRFGPGKLYVPHCTQTENNVLIKLSAKQW